LIFVPIPLRETARESGATPTVLDAALISAVTERDEMARYGTLMARAAQLGRADCVSMLQRMLEEERRQTRS
jgi:ferritin-like metal-binding protein YciE